MSLGPGDRLGVYEILDRIGAGGMGEVYRARDTRPQMGREVAIKVCGAQFGERFEREARTIAQFNHHNICTLFDVGPNYLVMEMIEGPTLADVLRNGRLGVEEALSIARQIAEALDYSNDRGVVHRDLKPANVKVKPDGMIKVLDFGLAKATSPGADRESNATITLGGTLARTVIGTPAYMSPEQASGKPVDRRSDIWAFGAVLYEMVSGKPLFTGETIAEILASVIKDEPDWTVVPGRVERLIRKCLEKDPKRRLRSASDMDLLLEGSPAPPTRPHRKLLPWALAFGGMLLAGLAGRSLSRPPQASAGVTMFQVPMPPQSSATIAGSLALSPDGRRLAFSARDADQCAGV